MKKLTPSALLFVIGAMLILVGSCSKSPQSALYKEIKSTNQLVFASMDVTKTLKIIDNGSIVKWGKRVGVYSFNINVEAYIDLSSLQVEDLEFDEGNKIVKVSLPPIQTKFPGRDDQIKAEFERCTGLRESLYADDLDDALKEAQADFDREFEKNPDFKAYLIQTAETKARKYFEAVFENFGYTASIDFKPSK